MQDRARVPLRSAGWWLLVLATSLPAAACSQEGPLSDEEMSTLRQLAMPAPLPEDRSNEVADDPAAARLGKKLYFDPRYAGKLGAYNVTGRNGALGNQDDEKMVSCASCHDPGKGGADLRSRPSATSLGAGYTSRNAPTVINSAYSPLWQFWDGRADSLWSQALLPPEGEAECNGNRLRVAHVIIDHYRQDYDDVFATRWPDYALATAMAANLPADGKPGAIADCQAAPDNAKEPFLDAYDCLSSDDRAMVDRIYANFGKAIAAYERRLVSTAFAPSAFDRFMAGDTQAMSPAAIRGARLFVGHAGCMECHNGPALSDFSFHNVGAPQTGEYAPATDLGRATGIADVTVSAFSRKTTFSDDREGQATAAVLALASLDDGAKQAYAGQFKTPTLRNVAKTAPYMHDGAYQSLWDVVNHYNFGGATGQYSGVKDPAIAPLMLTDAELSDLVEFLRALDDGDALPDDNFPDPDGLVGTPPLP